MSLGQNRLGIAVILFAFSQFSLRRELQRQLAHLRHLVGSSAKFRRRFPGSWASGEEGLPHRAVLPIGRETHLGNEIGVQGAKQADEALWPVRGGIDAAE